MEKRLIKSQGSTGSIAMITRKYLCDDVMRGFPGRRITEMFILGLLGVTQARNQEFMWGGESANDAKVDQTTEMYFYRVIR